jgi:DNA polymerase IV
VCSGKAKPNGLLYVVPGREEKFLAPLAVRDIPGVGKVTEQKLHSLGIRKVGDLAQFDGQDLEQQLGKWAVALAGKARGQDAGAWFEGEIGREEAAKSISHEHTYDEDTAQVAKIEATLMRLCEMVGRRLREQQLRARTLQLKLRYQDFTTITRAHTLAAPTQLDNEIFEQIDRLFHAHWRAGWKVRLLGVQAWSFSDACSQSDFFPDSAREKWQHALSAADRVRDKFGEASITFATGMKGTFRERTHENPAALPGKGKKQTRPGN